MNRHEALGTGTHSHHSAVAQGDLFREAGKLYAFTKWKGDESACATFYAIFEIGVQLTEVTFSGEECDV